MDDILRTSLDNTESGTRSVLNSVAEKVMLDLLRQDVATAMLDAHKAKFFDTDADDVVLSKSLSTLRSFMALNVSLFR